MQPSHTFLVAVDVDAHAASVVLTALTYALPLRAKVILAAVVTPAQTAFEPAHAALPEDHATEALEVTRVREALEALTLPVTDAGLVCETTLLQGPPVEALLDTILTHRADTVVVGTHGRSGVARVVLGSVAEGVLHGARVPVIVVRIPS